MKITFIGSGASDWPVSRKNSGEYRRFSSILIGNDLLVDPGPHIFDFEESCHPDLFRNVKNILLTHSHDDHLCTKSVERLCAQGEKGFWCEKHASFLVPPAKGLTLHRIEPFLPFSIGEYTVTALPANHGTTVEGEIPLHFIIETKNARLFYGCDGAWFLRNTWYHLRQFSFDLMILDGTLGNGYGDCRIFEHNNLKMVELMAAAIRNAGVLKPKGKIMISHLACGAHESHSRVEEQLKEVEIGVAGDGRILEIGE